MIWKMVVVVVIAGALGGVVNAYLTDNGFIKPKNATEKGVEILRPGVVGNVLIGVVAALVTWGLLSQYSVMVLVSGSPATNPPTPPADLTLGTVIGALLAGIGGAKVLTTIVDKRLVQAAASMAADSNRSNSAAQQIANAKPADALRIAAEMSRSKLPATTSGEVP